MRTLVQESYTARTWNLAGLAGISDRTVETHFGLYEGYVKNTNLLNEHLATILQSGKIAGSDPTFAEIKRRLGFEYNGMRLHEYYFDNLSASGGSDPQAGEFKDALIHGFGDFETWKKDFAAVGAMRGVGWAIAYLDPASGRVSNHWIELHQDGNVAGFVPLVVMDVWEHAYILDHKPADRSKYIEAFFANINWKTVEARCGPGKASNGN